MSGYRLHRPEGTATYWKITQGRRWVGRVWRNATAGTWHARLGDHTAMSTSTPQEAFERAAALALGYATPAALHQRNAAVRQRNAAARDRARAAAREFMAAGSWPEREAALDKLFFGLTGRKLP